MRLSVVIPTLNEARYLAATLTPLQACRRDGHEIIVVDGGSSDGSAEACAPLADRVIKTARGRAQQMNAGARLANGDIVLFLHADTKLPRGWERQIVVGLVKSGRQWGRFDVRLSGPAAALRMVETLMNWRSRLTGIATGDQSIFVRRAAFEEVGGFPEIALMEDIALSRRLKQRSPPLCLRQCVITSSRRWERHGIARTIARMWYLRLAYRLGADPQRLARSYYPHH